MTKTITVDAWAYEDADDCLAAAAADVCADLGLEPWQAEASWVGGEDGERDEIAVVVEDGATTAATVLEAARTIEAGEYVYEYDEGTDDLTSQPRTMGDDQVAEIQRILRARGLRMDSDDRGWLVSERS